MTLSIKRLKTSALESWAYFKSWVYLLLDAYSDLYWFSFQAMEFVHKLLDLRNGRAKSEVLDSGDTPLDVCCRLLQYLCTASVKLNFPTSIVNFLFWMNTSQKSMVSVSDLQHEFYQNLPDVDVGELANNHKKPNPNAVAHTTVSLHRYPFFVAATSPLSSSSNLVASDPRQYASAVHPLIHQRLNKLTLVCSNA